MGLPPGIWPLVAGLLWAAEALLLGGRAAVAGNPPGGDGDDDILRINRELIPPEAPGSSFLLEGDIVKASPFRAFSSASPKWPKRRGIVQIPYVLSYKYDSRSVKLIKEAFADFAASTCIKFVPYSYQRDFISVAPMAGCFSSVGRTGGMQVVSLAPACLRRGKGVALHEFMHVAGFWHEHSRADRDRYISISWDEILTGFEINFMKAWTSNMLVKYDYSSVLHYGRYAFSMTGLPTITPLSDPYAALGQRWNLSSSDIARVNKLYKCSQTGAEAGSPSTIKEDITSNELEPCPTEGETKVSTTSPTSRASSPGTNSPETAPSAWGPSEQMSRPTAETETFMGRTAMNDELGVSLTTVRGLQSVKFAPTRLSTQSTTYLEATGKTPPTHTEMGTAEAEGKSLIPMGETSLLGTVSLQESDFTTVMASPESQPSPREVTGHQGKGAEGLGTTKIPTETFAGLEFPELVSSGVAPVETGPTGPSEVGIAETTSIQGMELAHHSTYWARKGPSPAAEVRVVALTSNQPWSPETQTELATAEITSSLEVRSGTYTPVMHTATSRALGQTPPVHVRATETSHPISPEKQTTNLPRLTSAKSVTTMAPTRARPAPARPTPSVEMETTTVAYATEQTSLPTTQNWTSSLTKQRNQLHAWWATTPGSQEQSTIAIPARGLTKTEPTEAMQPTLTTSFKMAENHTTSPELFPLGATTRHQKSTSLISIPDEDSSIEPPTKAITSMETQTELGFVKATRIKASGHYGFPSLTEGTYFPVTKAKGAEYATETETLPVTWVSQASEPAEMSIQATTANYRNKERTHTATIGPTYTLSLGESGNPVTHPQNAGPAETTRHKDGSQATLSTRSSTEMGVQETRNTSPNQRRGHTYTPASVLTASTATELKFVERPTREASGLETTVAQASSPSEMGIAGVSSAWPEAKDQFSSSPREATPFPRSSATEKGNSTKAIQSLESASLSEVGTKEHRVGYRAGAGLFTRNPPESGPPVQSMEMPELTSPGKLTPIHTEPTINQAQTGVRASLAKTVMDAEHATRAALPLETLENQTLRLREVAIKEETSPYKEGGLTTTHPLPSVTLGAETAEQVQSTHVRELILPENWPTGKHTPKKTQRGEEPTSPVSMGELPSLESEPTKPVYPTEGTSLLQASPHPAFSLAEEQITTTNSRETPWEEPGRSPMSPGGVQAAETEAPELLGVSTPTTSTWPPETPAQRSEGASVFHRKRGSRKPSPLPTGTAWPAESEAYLVSSTKTAPGMEALEGQTTYQTVLGMTEVSLAQLLGGSTRAERAGFPGAEVTEAVTPVLGNGTETQTTLPNKTRELIPTARARSVGTVPWLQSYSTPVEAVGTPSSLSERLLYTATSGSRKKNGGQAYTRPPPGSVSSAGSNATSTRSSLGLPYYRAALASTEPTRTRLESGAQSVAGETVPAWTDSSLETQAASAPAGGHGRESTASVHGGVTPLGRWGLRPETLVPGHASRSENWALHPTTAPINGELSTPPAQSPGVRSATNSAVGGMPTTGAEKAQGTKAIQWKRAFRRHPGALSAVDPEILHLVGKRSLPDAVASRAPPQVSNPALQVIPLAHGQAGPGLHRLLLSNPLEKHRAKALEAFPKQHGLLPGSWGSPVTALYPAAQALRSRLWWLGAGASNCALGGFLRSKEQLFLGRKKASPLAPFLASAEAVQPRAAPGTDKLTAAPLPRQQSGPGEQGHSARTTAKALEESGLLEWQVCNFAEDLCGWRQSDADDFDWTLAGERPARSLPGGNVSDPRASPSGGHYLSLRSPSARRSPGQKTALISPILHGIGCIRFRYSPLGSPMGTINLYLKPAGAPAWRRIWTAEEKQGTEWHQVGVVASESQKLQVMVEGIMGPEAGSDAGIADLAVCPAGCRGGCQALLALYKR